MNIYFEKNSKLKFQKLFLNRNIKREKRNTKKGKLKKKLKTKKTKKPQQKEKTGTKYMGQAHNPQRVCGDRCPPRTHWPNFPIL
jgi:hypothetical protein